MRIKTAVYQILVGSLFILPVVIYVFLAEGTGVNKRKIVSITSRALQKAQRVQSSAMEQTMSDEVRTSIEHLMKNRNYYLQKRCRSVNSSVEDKQLYKKYYLNNILVNRKHQLLFCAVPKVANTNFRRIFLGLSEVVPKEKISGISGHDVYFALPKTPILRKFNVTARQLMMKSFKKILFVREPLDRLLSGYRNKFFHENKNESDRFYANVRLFYEKYPVLGSTRNITMDPKNQIFSFHDFLQYWTDVYEVGEKDNMHFRKAYDLCSPCDINYDYIGKFESLSRDSEFIFEKLGIDMRFPKRNDNSSIHQTSDLVREYYERIPKPLLHKVRNILELDFKLFGYQIPAWFP